MPVLRGAGNQTSGEGAEGRFQTNGCGCKATGAQQQIGTHQFAAGGIELINHPIEGWRCLTAEHKRHHHEQHRGDD